MCSCSPLMRPLPGNGDSKLPLNWPPQERPPLLLDGFFIAEGVALYWGELLYWISSSLYDLICIKKIIFAQNCTLQTHFQKLYNKM